jgi:hypothetical protein
MLVTRIWANDGWCYIPEMKERQRFFHIKDGYIEFESQQWTGVIPTALSSELVTYFLYSNSPLSWAEQGKWGYEAYEQIDAIPHNRNQESHFLLP